MDDWNGDVKLINHHLNFGLNFDFFSAIELDWWFTEENVALLFYLSISNSNIFVIGDHEVLINGVLINLLLLDSSNHFFFIEIDVSQLGHQFYSTIAVECSVMVEKAALKLPTFPKTGVQNAFSQFRCFVDSHFFIM